MSEPTRITLDELQAEIKRITGRVLEPKGFSRLEIQEAAGCSRDVARGIMKQLLKAGWQAGREQRKDVCGRTQWVQVVIPPEGTSNAKLPKNAANTDGSGGVGKTAHPNISRLVRALGRGRKTS